MAELRSGRVMGVARFVQVMHKKHLSNVYFDFFLFVCFLVVLSAVNAIISMCSVLIKQTLREFRECLANTSFTVFIQSMCSGIRRFVCHRWNS